LIKVYKNEGVRGFFKGTIASCYKEGFFAGLYYLLYEEGKKIGMPSMVSGVISGMFCTALTHPF
jgi:hypothetical protein